MQRVWKKNDVKPHLVKRFELSNDPRFEDKLRDVVPLYLNPPEHALVLTATTLTSHTRRVVAASWTVTPSAGTATAAQTGGSGFVGVYEVQPPPASRTPTNGNQGDSAFTRFRRTTSHSTARSRVRAAFASHQHQAEDRWLRTERPARPRAMLYLGCSIPTIWFALTFSSLVVVPSGQRTSTTSACFSRPRPKCGRMSSWDR